MSKELNYFKSSYTRLNIETNEEYNQRMVRIKKKAEFLKEMNMAMFVAKLFIEPLKEKMDKESKAYAENYKKVYHIDYMGMLY